MAHCHASPGSHLSHPAYLATKSNSEGAPQVARLVVSVVSLVVFGCVWPLTVHGGIQYSLLNGEATPKKLPSHMMD